MIWKHRVPSTLARSSVLILAATAIGIGMITAARAGSTASTLATTEFELARTARYQVLVAYPCAEVSGTGRAADRAARPEAAGSSAVVLTGLAILRPSAAESRLRRGGLPDRVESAPAMR